MLLLLTNMAREDLIAQLQDGLILMLLGMGTVFIFLTVLIFTTKGLSAICRKTAPSTPSVTAKPQQKATVATSTNKDTEIAAAIAVAYSKSKQN
ncbi:MAG: OadG family protein [Spirochaetales bacterium]|jgi:oxaloacetate decarboxylase (Na+ extruding) subunit gamma|nr:OadG family protein [Spirochaetales bacterium]